MRKWRHVSSDSDGHQVNQCLSCKERWTGHPHRYDVLGWRFCPMCGVEFSGRHECVAHDDRHPEWYGKWKRLEPHFWWVIEERWVYQDPEREPGKWQRKCSYAGFFPAREIRDRLRLERAPNPRDDEEDKDNWYMRPEFRVRISHDPAEGTASWWIPSGGLWGS